MKAILIATLMLAVASDALATPPATAENERIARRVFDEILSQGKFDLAAELYAPDFVNHGRNSDVGLDVDQAAARGWKQAIPDIALTVELTVAEGDRVAALWRGRGTNSGSGNGLPATGKRINGRGITIWRIEKGRVREEWSEFSVLDLLRQVGLAPGGEPLSPDGGPRARSFPAAREKVSAATVERNRGIVTSAFEEVLGGDKFDQFDGIYARDFVNHGAMNDHGLRQEIENARRLRGLAPDLRVTVTQSLAEGDLVAVVYVLEAAHGASGSGMPAAGSTFRARGMSIMRVNDEGRITEEWSVLDSSQLPE